jgi:hypothetical protein
VRCRRRRASSMTAATTATAMATATTATALRRHGSPTMTATTSQR